MYAYHPYGMGGSRPQQSASRPNNEGSDVSFSSLVSGGVGDSEGAQERPRSPVSFEDRSSTNAYSSQMIMDLFKSVHDNFVSVVEGPPAPQVIKPAVAPPPPPVEVITPVEGRRRSSLRNVNTLTSAGTSARRRSTFIQAKVVARPASVTPADAAVPTVTEEESETPSPGPVSLPVPSVMVNDTPTVEATVAPPETPQADEFPNSKADAAPVLLVTSVAGDDVDHVSDDDDDEDRFEKDVRIRRKSMNVANISLLTAEGDKEDKSIRSGLDIARRMSSVIHEHEEKSGGIELPGQDLDLIVKKTAIKVYMPNDMFSTFLVHDMIDSKELLQLAVEKYENLTGEDTTSLRLFVKEPRRPDRQLYAGELPLVVCSKIRHELEHDDIPVDEESVTLLLAPEKQKRPISIFLSENFSTKFLVPSNVTAQELTEFAKVKWNRVNQLPEDDESKPLCIVMRAPYKNDRVLKDNEEPFVIAGELISQNSYLTVEKIDLFIKVDYTKSPVEAESLSAEMLAKEYQAKSEADNEIYDLVLRAIICTPESTDTKMLMERLLKDEEMSRRRSSMRVVKQITLDDISALHNACVQRIMAIGEELGEVDPEATETYNIQNEMVLHRMFRLALHTYASEFLTNDAAKLVQMEDVDQGDLLSIFDNTLRQTMQNLHNAIETRASTKTVKEEHREVLKQHMATLEEVQDEVIVDIKDMFRELVTKAFEKPKISLEDDITDASADAAVESAASAAANEGADADDDEMDWGDDLKIFDWNAVTGGYPDGTPYSKFFNRALSLVQRSLGIPDDVHRQTVLAEINNYNSNPTHALEMLKLRLAVCVHDKHPFYNEFTINPSSYQRWKEVEKGSVQQLLATLLTNRRRYISKLQSMKSLNEAMMSVCTEEVKPLSCELTLDIQKITGTKSCSRPHVNIRIGSSQLRSDTVSYDSFAEEAVWTNEKMKFDINDVAQSLELEINEENEGVDTSARRKIGILTVPVFELLPLSFDNGEFVEESRWFDLSPKGRILFKISANLHNTGMKKSGYTDIAAEGLFSGGFHTRYLTVLQYGDRCAFNYYAPDPAMIRKLVTEVRKQVPKLELPPQSSQAPKVLPDPLDVLAETESTGSLGHGSLAPIPIMRMSTEQGKSGTVEYETGTGKWEEVTLSIAHEAIVMTGHGYDKSFDLKGCEVSWAKKNFFKPGVIQISGGGSTIKVRSSSRESNNIWYDALTKAIEDGASVPLVSPAGGKTKKIKSLRNLLKKDKSDSGSFAPSFESSKSGSAAELPVQSELYIPPAPVEVSSRKRSMAVFSDIQARALKAGFGQAPEEVAEKEVEARHTKMGFIYCDGFFVEETLSDDIPELTLWTEEEKTIRLRWDLEDDSTEEFQEWKKELMEMSDRMRAFKFNTYTLDQLNNLLQLLEKQLDGDDWPYVYYTRLRDYFKARIAQLQADNDEVSQSETTEHAEQMANELKPSKKDVMDYHGYFRHLIYALHQATLTSTGGWLLEKYGTMYGVPTVYRSLIFLDYLARKYSQEIEANAGRTPTYLIMLLDIFSYIESISKHRLNANSDGEIYAPDGIAMTIFERAILEDCLDLLEGHQTEMTGAYKTWFPYAKGGLADTLKLLKVIINVKQKFGFRSARRNSETELSVDNLIDKNQSPEEAFAQVLTFHVERATRNRYDVRKEMLCGITKKPVTADQVCRLADAVIEELQADEDYFQKVFQPYFNLMKVTMATYVMQLTVDVSKCLCSDGVDEFSLFKIYFKLKRLYEAFEDARPRSLGVVMSSFDALVVAWLRNVKRQTLKWTLRALQQDKLVPETDKNLHSSSVVDLFCCLNDSHDFLEKLDWKDPASRITFNMHYADLLASAVQTYVFDVVNKLKTQYVPVGNATNVMGNPDLSPKIWSQQFFVTLNNVDMALSQSRKLYEDMKEDIAKQLEKIEQQKKEGTWTEVKPNFRHSQLQLEQQKQKELQQKQSSGASKQLAPTPSRTAQPQQQKRAPSVQARNSYMMFSNTPPPPRQQSAPTNSSQRANPGSSGSGGGQQQTSDVQQLRYYDGGPTDPSDWLEQFRNGYQRARRLKDVLVGALLRTMLPEINKSLCDLFGKNRNSLGKPPPSMNQIASDCDVTEAEIEFMLNPLMEYLDQKLAILNSYLYQSVFSHVLRALWAMICKSMQDIVSPPAEGTNVKWTLGRALSPREYIVCTQALQMLVEFFNADGDGLPLEVLKETEYRDCMGVLAQCSATTQELIKDYQRELATPDEKARVLNALRVRHNDNTARNFYRQVTGKEPQTATNKLKDFFG